MDIERLKEMKEVLNHSIFYFGRKSGKTKFADTWFDVMEFIDEAIARQSVTSEEAFPSAIKWTGKNLREVIDLTGWNESASSKWTWEEYEQVVKEKGLKIFTPDGSVMAGIGDWIVRNGNDCFVLKVYQPVAISKTETTSCEWCEKVGKYAQFDFATYTEVDGDKEYEYAVKVNYCPNCGSKLN